MTANGFGVSPKDPALARIIAFHEGLTPADVARLREICAAGVRFRDPLNDVHGRAALERVFAKMFDDLADVRFTVTDATAGAGGGFLAWQASYRMKRHRPGVVRTIHGVAHLRLGPAGRIVHHRDCRDAAEDFCAHLALDGALLRWVRRRWADAGAGGDRQRPGRDTRPPPQSRCPPQPGQHPHAPQRPGGF